MSERPTIVVKRNGPYLVTGCRKLRGILDGKEHATEGTIALCRCGASKNKPFCDGTHKKVGFTGDKEADHAPDRREDYRGEKITIHDNRGVCARAGRCTDELASVFRLREEPWIDPDAESMEKIVDVIRQCPSGALSYSIDGAEHRDYDAEPVILVVPNGPYAIAGGAELDDVEWGEGASREHFDLCRCGKSKNKPFCNGAHWQHRFDEHAPAQED